MIGYATSALSIALAVEGWLPLSALSCWRLVILHWHLAAEGQLSYINTSIALAAEGQLSYINTSTALAAEGWLSYINTSTALAAEVGYPTSTLV